jgi:hypothetical protein
VIRLVLVGGVVGFGDGGVVGRGVGERVVGGGVGGVVVG